jgi:hypothetical protein
MTISGDRWPDDVRLSDIEPRFACTACGKRGADVRPDFNWNRMGLIQAIFREFNETLWCGNWDKKLVPLLHGGALLNTPAGSCNMRRGTQLETLFQ